MLYRNFRVIEADPHKFMLNKIFITVLGSVITLGAVTGTTWVANDFCPANTWFKKETISKNNLVIGMFSKPENFAPLVSYLKCNLKNVNVSLIGDSKYSYQEGKNQIAQKKWDIAFVSSPMLAVAAKDNNYTFATRTFPDQDRYYKTAIFTSKDSPINSIQEISEDTKIALGNVNSTATFYAPAYELYGIKAKIDVGVSAISDKVEQGEYDIGTAVYDTAKKNPNLKIIQVSRDIPGGGIYLSPQLTKDDQEIVRNLLLNAPPQIQKQANFGAGSNPEQDVENDYTEYKKIAHRVQEILVCTDFDAPVVYFFCPQGQLNVISGNLKSYKILSNNQVNFLMSLDSGGSYNLIVPQDIISRFSENLDDLLNGTVKVYNVQPVIQDNSTQLIITSDKQLVIN